MGRRFWTVGAACALALLSAACTSNGDSRPTPTPASVSLADPVVTPIVAVSLADAHPVLGTDNRVHLAYELFVTNPTSATVSFTKLEVLDGSTNSAGGATLTTSQGDDLQRSVRPFDGSAPKTVGPGQTTRIFLDTTLAATATVPRELVHRVGFTLTSTQGQASALSAVTGRVAVATDRPVVIGPPLQGGRWLVGGGCCDPASYHRTATLPVNGEFHAPERFAVDFVQLDAANRLFTGPREVLASYPYFGAKILSVADGVVVEAHDGEPEQTPPNFPANASPASAGGNAITVDIGNGNYAYYAHLQPGTVKVKAGQRVSQGDVLGLLGNTGNSDGPHLHFQIMAGPLALASEGLPFVIDRYTSEGSITSDIDTLLGGAAAVVTTTGSGTYRNRMPLQNEIVGF